MCVASGGSLPIRSLRSHFHFLSKEISTNVLYFVSRRLVWFAVTDLLSAPPLSTLVSKDQLDLEFLDNGANFLWMLSFGIPDSFVNFLQRQVFLIQAKQQDESVQYCVSKCAGTFMVFLTELTKCKRGLAPYNSRRGMV